MGLEVITQPPADWSAWVSASALRNHVLGDPLLDWLELHGEAHGFERDTAATTYDPRTDFTEFIFRQGNLFEEAVLRHLRTLTPIVRIADGSDPTQNEDDIRRRKMRESIYVEGASLFTADGEVDEEAIRQLVDAINRKWGLDDGDPSGGSTVAPKDDLTV